MDLIKATLCDEQKSVLLYLGLAAVTKRVVASWCSVTPKKKVLVGKVSELMFFPVKSMGGFSIKEAEVTRIGMKEDGGMFDRHFAVVSGTEPAALTAKLTTSLATVKTEVSERSLKLSCPRRPDLGTVLLSCNDIEKNGQETEDITLHMMSVRGLDCGPKASAFLDGIIGSPGHRLIYLPERGVFRRSVKESTQKYSPWQRIAKDNDHVGYQDCTQIMLMTQESQDDFNKRLVDCTMEFDRFRPNIIASETTPYDEDSWNEVHIGDCKMTLLKLCSRCLMTCVDTETGEKHPAEEPLKSLRKYRMLVEGFGFGPCLGINLIVDTPGKIKVGDPIYAVKGPIKLTPPPE